MSPYQFIPTMSPATQPERSCLPRRNRKAGHPWLRPVPAALIAVLTGAGSAAQQASQPVAAPTRPNVLLLLTDDQRPDTIRALGNRVIRTPSLDRLVREGTAFTNAFCAYPVCVPSRAEIITGSSGFRTGVLPPYSNQLHPGVPTWALSFRDAGYRTGYVGKWHTVGTPRERGYQETPGLFTAGGAAPPGQQDHRGRPVTGYQGWVFRDAEGKPLPERGVGLQPGTDRAFADAALEFLGREPERPFFLHVNFTGPHDPLHQPPGDEFRYSDREVPLPRNFLRQHPFDHGNLRGRDELLFTFPRTEREVREELTVYYGVIQYVDAQIGRILQALRASGREQRTLIMFASDHGLAIGSHGLRGKQNMYEHTIRSPLLLRGPGIPAGRREAAPVYLRDLYPTACAAAGIPVPAVVEGKSLLPLLRDEVRRLHPETYGYYGDSQRMVRTERWKLVRYPRTGREQLFDLQKDPDEKEDRSLDGAAGSVLADLRRRLDRWQEEVRDPARLPAPGG